MSTSIRTFFTVTLDTIAVLLVLGAGVLFVRHVVFGKPESEGTPPHAAASERPGSSSAPLAPADFWGLITSGQRIGPEDAAVTIVVFSDYACGFCAQLNETLSLLRRRYPQHLAVVVKHLVDLSVRPRFNIVLVGAAPLAALDSMIAANFADRRLESDS